MKKLRFREVRSPLQCHQLMSKCLSHFQLPPSQSSKDYFVKLSGRLREAMCLLTMSAAEASMLSRIKQLWNINYSICSVPRWLPVYRRKLEKKWRIFFKKVESTSWNQKEYVSFNMYTIYTDINIKMFISIKKHLYKYLYIQTMFPLQRGRLQTTLSSERER